MTYQDGYDDAIQYCIDLYLEFMYEWDDAPEIPADAFKEILNHLYKAKTH